MFDFVLGAWFPWLETVHAFGFSLWIGSILILDLKLLGISKRAPYYHYHMVPWAYAGLALVLVTGLLFVAAKPSYLSNPALQIKLVLIVAAGALATVFHSKLVAAHIDTASDDPTPTVAKLAGATSMALWLAVLVFARMIPYQIVMP